MLALRMRVWSTAYVRVLHAIIDSSEFGAQATLYIEPHNQVDSTAIAVVVKLPEWAIGGDSVNAKNGDVGQRVGYISRKDASKPALFAQIARRDTPMQCAIKFKSGDFWIEPHDTNIF